MRIAIVNDLPLAVEALRRVVCSHPDYKVAWIAPDGAEAVRLCAESAPDMILMDLIMPVMNGVEATRLIMQNTPCPILVVTATVDGNIGLVFDAMGHGALDAVNTPVLGADGKAGGAKELLRKIELIGHLISRPTKSVIPEMPAGTPKTPPDGLPLLVALGASTGGPAAVAKILTQFPAATRMALVVVQHVDQEFAPALADWLGRQCKLPVQIAKSGCRPEPGVVWLAATNDHLILTAQGTMEYHQEPEACFYRPSVDVFFKSLAAHWPRPGIAALLTGMGRDGAEGLLALREIGWHTLAQDRWSSVVYGMPRAAAELGAAEKILPVDQMAVAIQQLAATAWVETKRKPKA